MPELSKSAIGEYLGDGDAFNIQVMHSFIDMFDFGNMAFVQALRTFLQSFRLPGEAQKIDRIMEKFADRFVETNPNIFAKADTAYTLAFSIMMLNTDQHSPSIKHRMDKAAFVRMNRGINEERDLPEEFLGAIFDEIHSEEIVLEEEKSGNIALMTMRLGAGELNEKQRLELYKKEILVIEKKSRQLIDAAGESNRSSTPFKSVKQADIARPMFTLICWPLMAAFGLLFESSLDTLDDDFNFEKYSNPIRFEAEDVSSSSTGPSRSSVGSRPSAAEPHIVDLCLQGFAGSIYIASIFKLDTERDGLISSLTNLTSLSHLSGIKKKNIKAIKTLITLANSLGEYLESSWSQILKVVSQLERIQILADRLPSLDGSSSKRSLDFKSGSPGIDEQLDAIKTNHILEQLVLDFQTQSRFVLQFEDNSWLSLIAIDRIFTASTRLSGNAIVHFFKSVCQVSLEEVGLQSQCLHGDVVVTVTSQPFNPRMYLLQKLVEIASYNLHRIRFEWTQIWRLLQPHFNAVACHPNPTVSKFAVDSLRQLSMKFLEKEELGNYSTQVEFLKSFEWIMKKSESREVQDLILNSIAQMLSARAQNIRSGWKSIFIVLAQPTKSSHLDENLIRFAFSIVQTIFDKYFDLVYSTHSFVEYTACLAEFARMNVLSVEDIVVASIQLLRNCAVILMKHVHDETSKTRDNSPTHPPVTSGRNGSLFVDFLDSKGLLVEDHFHLEWFPMFTAFSKVVIHSETITIRSKAIEALFEILNESGHLFDPKYWKVLHRNVIIPIFEDLKDPDHEKNAREANVVLWISGLRLWVETFTTFFDDILNGTGTNVLQVFLKLMLDMMQRKDEKLAPAGQICFCQWIQNNHSKSIDDSAWRVIVDHIELAFQVTLPVELVHCTFKVSSNGEEVSNIGAAPDSFSAGVGLVSGQTIYDQGKRTASKVAMQPLDLEQLDFEHTKIKCMTHIELVQSFGSMLVWPGKEPASSLLLHLPSFAKTRVLECFRDSYAIARYFNSYYDLRYAIWKSGMAQYIPNLVKQETASLSHLIRILFGIYKSGGDDEGESHCSMLVDETMDVFHRFIASLVDQVKNQRDVSTCGPVVIIIFEELLDMNGWWHNPNAESPSGAGHSYQLLKKQLPVYFKLGIRMMNVDRPDIRMTLQRFMEKVGDEFIRIV